MQRRKIKPIHALLMLFAVVIIFLFLAFTMYYEDRLSASDGFILGILSCFTYGGILFYITGKKDKMTADHDYISIFDKVKNIDNLTSGEVLDKLESLYPKKSPIYLASLILILKMQPCIEQIRIIYLLSKPIA